MFFTFGHYCGEVMNTSPSVKFFGTEGAVMVLVAFIFALPNTLGEELGWRGFALPKLQAKYNALIASIILGLFWGIWHIPMWISFGQTGLSLVVNCITLVGVTILFTWIYNSTNGSLLLIWLFHFVMTVRQYIMSSIPTITPDILTWIIVLVVIIKTGPMYLSCKKELVQI